MVVAHTHGSEIYIERDSPEYDATQLAMMEEMCIVTDFQDNVIGGDTKKNVHLIDGVCMLPGGPPHRAFSVFLFNENHELLVQKRCNDKILFPEHWANTCCSHPLADGATFPYVFLLTPLVRQARRPNFEGLVLSHINADFCNQLFSIQFSTFIQDLHKS